MDMKKIKKMIVKILEHPEADEGLHLRNFINLHEEDERPGIDASEKDVLTALRELINEGIVIAGNMETETIYELAD